jgi:hypothetical protein
VYQKVQSEPKRTTEKAMKWVREKKRVKVRVRGRLKDMNDEQVRERLGRKWLQIKSGLRREKR